MKLVSAIRKLIIQYWDIVSYLFFGALTTLVNFLVYFPLFNWLGLSGAISNAVAWAAAVAFAYLTNKPFVFKSNDWSLATVIPELAKFVGCRIGSGLLETVAIWIFVDIMHWNGNVLKIVLSVLVVILNYIFSKWIVFVDKSGK
jgi:putative flippase GtrA